MASRESSHKVQVRSSAIQKITEAQTPARVGAYLAGEECGQNRKPQEGRDAPRLTRRGSQASQRRAESLHSALPAAAIYYDVLSSPI